MMTSYTTNNIINTHSQNTDFEKIKRFISIKTFITAIALTTMMATTLNAAVFNAPSTLINIPVYEKLVPGEMAVGISTGIYSESNIPTYEFDYMGAFSVSRHFQIGFSFVNSSQLVGNIHYTIPGAKENEPKIFVGIQNITQKTKLSSFDNYEVTQENNLSPYIGTSVQILGANIHLGIGKRRFESTSGIMRGLSGIASLANGIFGGFDYDFFNGKLLMDFDGKNINMGYRLQLTKSWAFNLGITELLAGGQTNPNYNNAPTRHLTFSFMLKDNFLSYQQEYILNKTLEAEEKLVELNKLQKELLQAKKSIFNELEQFKREKIRLAEDVSSLKRALKDEHKFLYESDKKEQDKLRENYLGVSSMLGEKVVQLYYESFEYYYQKQYLKAIELLSKAISLDPYIPMLHIRLGTIYYELEMYQEALENWKKALDLDPNNKELLNLYQKLKKRKK